jgi:nucleotide-binding universal stress UspA family protein
MRHQDTQYLVYDELEAIPAIARLLPRELASRYHALPVATDGVRITVAMANPDDKEARERINAIFGPSACVVRADESVIDKLLEEFYQEVSKHPPELLIWVPIKSSEAEIETYTDQLATLLDARLNRFETSSVDNQAYEALIAEIGHIHPNVVVLSKLEGSVLERLIEGSPEHKLTNQLPGSLLMVRQPRWPLKHILLILRNGASDESAVQWTISLAHLSGARVTILPLTNQLPNLDDLDTPIRCSLDTILASGSVFGKKLRIVAQQLVDAEISGTLRLRQEPPTWQIRIELLEHDYDLIVLNSEPHDELWHWILGELVNPLLSWTDRPVLVTKP